MDSLRNVPFVSNFTVYENNGSSLTPYEGTFSYITGVLTTTAPQNLNINIFVPNILPDEYTSGSIIWTISKQIAWIRDDGTLLPAILAYNGQNNPTLFVIIDDGTLALAGYNYNSVPINNGVVFGHYTSTSKTTFTIDSFYNDSTSLADIVVKNPAFVVNNTYYYWNNMKTSLTGNIIRVGDLQASSGNLGLQNIPSPHRYSLFIDSNNNLMVAKQLSTNIYQSTAFEDGQLLYQSGSDSNIFSLNNGWSFWFMFFFIIFIIITIIVFFMAIRNNGPIPVRMMN